MEILTWLDDHSRYALHISAHVRVTGPSVLTAFRETAAQHGHPASVLTDNGMVFTTRFAGGRGGRNHLEFELRERVRTDKVSMNGTVTLRVAGRLRHIGIGRTHAGTDILLLVQDLAVRIVNAATGEILRELIIDPGRDYHGTGRPPGPTPKKQ